MKHVVDVITGEVDDVPFANLTILGKGCVELRLDGAIAGMRRFYVAPCHRRTGVGTALFNAAVDCAKQYKMIAISWTVRKENAGAIAFYRKQGAQRFYDHEGEWYMGINFEDANK